MYVIVVTFSRFGGREVALRSVTQHVDRVLHLHPRQRKVTNIEAIMNEAIEEEILSINSIYGDDTLVVVSRDPVVCALRLPTASIVLRIELPSDYPDAPPSILGTETIGENAPKGLGKHAVDIARDSVAELYVPGAVLIFDVVEAMGPKIEEITEQSSSQNASHEDGASTAEEHGLVTDIRDLGPEPLWILSEPITEKKSVFLARAVTVASPEEAKQCIAHLKHTDKRVARASHNMTAWRIHGTGQSSYQDCDDDGETAAGGRLLHLMQLMDVWDVVVVVSRWYGGVHLGPDRFRLINAAARDALVKGGFANEGVEASKKKTKS